MTDLFNRFVNFILYMRNLDGQVKSGYQPVQKEAWIDWVLQMQITPSPELMFLLSNY